MFGNMTSDRIVGLIVHLAFLTAIFAWAWDSAGPPPNGWVWLGLVFNYAWAFLIWSKL